MKRIRLKTGQISMQMILDGVGCVLSGEPVTFEFDTPSVARAMLARRPLDPERFDVTIDGCDVIVRMRRR